MDRQDLNENPPNLGRDQLIEINEQPSNPMDQQSISSEKAWKSLEDELEKLSKSTSPSNCCIYRAPERLRQINEKAYTPQVVSIGPLHHGRHHLQSMEKEKKRYVQEFLLRTRISLEELFELISKKEKDLRSCYAEEIKFDHGEFVEMILVDAVFVIELLLRYSNGNLRTKQDRIFEKPYFVQDIWYDMWLLENQIPFFILDEIFNQKKVIDSLKEINPIIKLTYNYFNSLEAVNGKLDKFYKDNKIKEGVKHFTDFLRKCHLPPSPPKEADKSGEDERKEVVTAPSVIQLHQAGVKFKLRKSNELFDIRFSKGTLEIPPLKLQLETESLFRNLIAFEQRHYFDNYINDYIFIIHHLANSPKDVELLIEKQIIENWLPDKEGASTLINNLSRGTTVSPKEFYFSKLCAELDEYCAKSYNKWRTNLIQNYFNTPWASISVVGAIFLILLTMIQAVFSIIQVKIHP